MYVYAFLRHIFLFFFIPQHEDKDQVILVLQQQLAILHNKQKLRPRLSDFDRAFLVNLIKKFPNLKEYLIVVKPATILKWSKSLRIKLLNRKRKYLGGRPRLSKEVQKLIRELSEKNGWGIGKVYGELLYIGHKVSKSTIAKYMYRSENRIADRQSWRTFIRNSMGKTIAMDFFLVPTVNFKKVLYGFVVMSHDRRKILKIDVTYNPNKLWVLNVLKGVIWNSEERYKYLIRDNDGIYGKYLKEFLSFYEIKDTPTIIMSVVPQNLVPIEIIRLYIILS